MDQGIAAALAGIAGLLGSIGGSFVGGLLGGQKTVEAADLQVKGQATLSEEQWLREQRRQNYVALLSAHSDVKDPLLKLANRVRRGGQVQESEFEDLVQRTTALNAAIWNLRLLGPRRVTVAGQLLLKELVTVVDGLKKLQAGAVGWSAWDGGRMRMVEAANVFADIAGDVIRNPRDHADPAASGELPGVSGD
ncbi:hypothetical protein [Streptomyces boninensis]|uniref:hypothetical protein n=1 Tax=Streptomyces boninensis TaxID=2039455 RepID=UPI003B227875